MAAAVTIAPIHSNRPELTDRVKAEGAGSASKTETPLAPSNNATEYAVEFERLGVVMNHGGFAARARAKPDESSESTAAPEEGFAVRARGTSDESPQSTAYPPVVPLPTPSPLPYTFEMRQQWEGVVTRVDEDEFSVVLRDITTPNGGPELEAVLPIEEVSPDDLPLLVEGAVLYWTIGYEHTLTGQIKRVSHIRLRRLPTWTVKDLERVRRRAAELDELFQE